MREITHSRLAPDEATLQPSAGASLTGNIDALHAYEEEVAYGARLLTDQAEAAFGRAIKLGPGICHGGTTRSYRLDQAFSNPLAFFD